MGSSLPVTFFSASWALEERLSQENSFLLKGLLMSIGHALLMIHSFLLCILEFPDTWPQIYMWPQIGFLLELSWHNLPGHHRGSLAKHRQARTLSIYHLSRIASFVGQMVVPLLMASLKKKKKNTCKTKILKGHFLAWERSESMMMDGT